MIFVICVKLAGSAEHGSDLTSLEAHRVPSLSGTSQLVTKLPLSSPKGPICVQIWGPLTVLSRVWYFWALKIYFNYVHKHVDMYGIVNTSVVTMKTEREGQNTWQWNYR